MISVLILDTNFCKSTVLKMMLNLCNCYLSMNKQWSSSSIVSNVIIIHWIKQYWVVRNHFFVWINVKPKLTPPPVFFAIERWWSCMFINSVSKQLSDSWYWPYTRKRPPPCEPVFLKMQLLVQVIFGRAKYQRHSSTFYAYFSMLAELFSNVQLLIVYGFQLIVRQNDHQSTSSMSIL